MKRRPPGRDPDDDHSNYSTEDHDARNAKTLKLVTLVFGGLIIGAVLITILALVFSE